MPHQPDPPPGPRVFGRIDRFHCECPHCGTLLYAGKDPAVHRRHSTPPPYNPLTSRLTCSGCQRVYGVGLLLWPMKPARSTGDPIPKDHQPTRRQMAQLRQYATAIWAEQQKRQGEALNVAVDQACGCLPIALGGRDPFCPIHGWAK